MLAQLLFVVSVYVSPEISCTGSHSRHDARKFRLLDRKKDEREPAKDSQGLKGKTNKEHEKERTLLMLSLEENVSLWDIASGYRHLQNTINKKKVNRIAQCFTQHCWNRNNCQQCWKLFLHKCRILISLRRHPHQWDVLSKTLEMFLVWRRFLDGCIPLPRRRTSA